MLLLGKRLKMASALLGGNSRTARYVTQCGYLHPNKLSHFCKVEVCVTNLLKWLDDGDSRAMRWVCFRENWNRSHKVWVSDQKKHYFVRFQDLTAARMKIRSFCDVAPSRWSRQTFQRRVLHYQTDELLPVSRPALDTEARQKILSPLPGIEPRSPDHATRSQTPYWLSYPAHLYCS
jgi:hypothetical protein